MDFIVNFANAFSAFSSQCGQTLADNITGTIPSLICIFTLTHFITKAVGEKRVEKFARFMGKNSFLVYGVMVPVCKLLLSSGSAAMARFLPEKCKPGFQSSTERSVHVLGSIFPHVVPYELFVWLGIANGVEALGLNSMNLAARAVVLAIIFGCLSGLLTEYIFVFLAKRAGVQVD